MADESAGRHPGALHPCATTRAALVAALGILGLAPAAQATAPGSREALEIRVRNEVIARELVAPRLGSTALAAIETWEPWALERGYRFELDEAGRVLLVVPAGRRSTKTLWKLVDETLEELDELLPIEPARPKSGRDGLRLDDETGATGATGETGDRTGRLAPLSHRALDELPENRARVLFAVETQADYAALLERAAVLEPYLASWARSEGSLAGGFTLERPLIAGWVEKGEGREEWNPDNELVHRLAHLSLLERYSQLPFWLTTGLAWQIEQAVCGDIYCFPYRAGFVGVLEHSGWETELKSAYKKAEQPATLAELAGWRRGSFDESGAARAWGVARFLVVRFPDVLPDLLAELARDRLERGIVEHADGTWTRLPDYEVPLETQAELFARHLGPDYLAEMTEAFGRGRITKRR